MIRARRVLSTHQRHLMRVGYEYCIWITCLSCFGSVCLFYYRHCPCSGNYRIDYIYDFGSITDIVFHLPCLTGYGDDRMTRPMPGPPECTCMSRDNFCQICLDAIGWDIEEDCPICPIHAGPTYRKSKRLTDAECAAEYWESFLNYRENDLLGRIEHLRASIWEMGMEFFPSQYPYPRPPQFNEDTFRSVALKELKTWHRFASQPHALEQDTK